MSTQVQDDNVEIPEAAPADFASKTARKGMSPPVKFGLLVGGGLAVIGLSVFFMGTSAVDPTSSIRVDANLDSTPGGVVQSDSPRYQQLLEESNDQASIDALREGRTFIATPESILQPIDDLQAGSRVEDGPIFAARPVVEPEPPVAPVPERPQPVIVQAPPTPAAAPRPTGRGSLSNEEQENPYVESIIRQMGALSPKVPSGTLTIAATGASERRNAAERELLGSQGGADGSGSASTGTDLSGEQIIAAGEIIYAETLTSTNSDLEGSPVLVELTTGEHRGARLIGSFTVNAASDSMVVEFSTMTTAAGETIAVSAFAVDGMTAEGAVASDVERRYLKRYGPILAAAFVTSYADAISTPSQTLTTIGEENAVIQELRSTEQALYAGLSAATSAIGADLTANAPRGPKIILRDGWPLAVLFTESVVATQ